MKSSRALLLTLLALLLVVGISTGLLMREYRQERLNRDLIAAILAKDTPTALSILNAGADPNACMNLLPEEAVWQKLYNKLYGRPTHELPALFVALGTRSTSDNFFHMSTYEPGPNLELMNALIDRGANINAREDSGRTLLEEAVDLSEQNAVILLLHRGADPNIHDYFGEAPLFNASCDHKLTILKSLLEAHVDPNDKDEKGATALDMTIECGQKAAEQMLRKAGAKTGKELSSRSSH